jgi:hypothetical protein
VVGCTPRTVRNEVARNSEFADQLRQAKSRAQVSPLRTMQEAARTNWRAAAWWLERIDPEKFAPPEPATFGRREANRFVADLLTIIDQVVTNHRQREQFCELISAALPGIMRRAWEYRLSHRQLDDAMKFFRRRDFGLPDHDPCDEIDRMLESFDAQFGQPTNPTPPPGSAQGSDPSANGEKFRPPASYSPPPGKNAADTAPPPAPRSLPTNDLPRARPDPAKMLFPLRKKENKKRSKAETRSDKR